MDTLMLQRSIRMHKNSILTLIFLSVIGFYAWHATYFIPQRIECVIQALISDFTKKEFKKFISAQQNKLVHPKDLINVLKDNFLWIKDMTLVMKPGLISITIIPDIPIVVLNDSVALTQAGKIVAKGIFMTQFLDHLPTLTVEGGSLNHPDTFEKITLFIKTSPRELFNFYTVTWKNDHTIYLADKAQSNFLIITSADRLLTTKKLGDCLHIKKTLHTQLIKKTTDQWIADTRFADHIIVTKRGESHGSNVS